MNTIFANRSLASDTYVGQIIDLEDPERLGRVRVRVFGFTDNLEVEQHPWAILQLGLGAGVNRGHSPALKVDDYVQVRFQNGDSRYPVILSSALVAVEREVHLPAIAVDGPRSTAGMRTTPEEIPTSQSRGVPYLTDEVDLQHDLLIQRRANRSYRIAHMSQGSQFEMTSTGEIALHSPQAIWFSSSAQLQERYSTKLSKGLHSETILEGDFKLESSRFELSTLAPISFEAGGAMSLSALSVQISALDAITQTTTSSFSLVAGLGVDIFSGRNLAMRTGAGNIEGITTVGSVLFQATDIGPKLELGPLDGFNLQTPLVSSSGSMLGDYKVEGPTCRMRLNAEGSLSLESPMSELSFSVTGQTQMKNKAAEITLGTAGRIKVANQADNLASVLKDLVQAIQNIDVQTAGGKSGKPNNIMEFQTVARRLQMLLE